MTILMQGVDGPASITAANLVRELGKRMGELFLSTPTATGSTGGTTLVDATLTQYLPVTVGAGAEQFMPWVYGSTTVDTLNMGVTRRAQTWNASSGQTSLTFFTGAPWPTQITSSGSSGAPVYEIHLRSDRARKLEALNEAVGQLGLWWFRDFEDTSITTASNTWAYTLPSSQYIARLWEVAYQLVTDNTLTGFPYMDAVELNWTVRESTDELGNLTQILQFGEIPPWPRILRLKGEAYFPDLVNDSDVLALSGKYARPCLAWMYKYAAYLLNLWQGDQQPMGDISRYEQRETQLLAEADALKLAMKKPHRPGRILVPGRGQGNYGHMGMADSPLYLGGLHIGGS